MIDSNEKALTLETLEMARAAGAEKARATLCKSTEDLVATLDGEVDKVTRCADRSLSISIYADGRFGSFSTNKINRESLEEFIGKAVETVRMLAPDPCRGLPEKERCCTEARTGFEMDIHDDSYGSVSPEQRVRMALEASVTGKDCPAKLISEEGEYSESEYDVLTVDSEGLCCRHTETTYDYGVEVTVEDADGNKYNDYYWVSSPTLDGFDASECGMTAVRKAAQQIGGKPARSGRYNMVVSSEVASRLVSPILRALNAYSIQQGNSFLDGSLGQQKFPEGLTLVDLPHIKGQTGSKLFDSEGVATHESTIIDKGVVKEYFINSYMAAKLGMKGTIEDPTRPKVMPWPQPGLDLEAILRMCGDGIYVTDFNGGNSNSATGDFSYGVRGMLFRKGKFVRPVNEMLITGNFLELWAGLIAAGDDSRPCMSKLIPTLAFANVEFNG